MSNRTFVLPVGSLKPLMLIVVLLFMVTPDICYAYVGPGAGVTMIGALLAVIGTIFLTVFGLLLWPIRMLLRKMKAKKKVEMTEVTQEETGTKTS